MIFGLDNGWLWAIAGVVLLMAEIVAPGVFLMFIGGAAIVTGLLTLLLGLNVPLQLIVFVIAAAISVVIGKRQYENEPVFAGNDQLNDPGRRLAGKLATVVAPIDAASGRVRLGDSEWSARGSPALPGDRVTIVGVDGNCLIVEPAAVAPPAI